MNETKQIKPQREEFQISENGITHTPTEYSFAPHPGSPTSGSIRQGRLGNGMPDGRYYNSEEVKAMARKLWAEYLMKN
jgi:hypothetical protein